MDERDFRILAELVKDPTASLADVARTVRMSRSAVQARFKRLTESGPLAGFDAFPNPAIFGKVAILAAYGPDVGHPKPAKRVLEVPGVVGYSINHDSQLAVTFLAAGPDAPTPPALDRLMGAAPARRFVRETPALAPGAARLSRMDWDILRELLADPRISDARLARAVGGNVRTVARRRARMRDRGVYRVIPGILSNRASGVAVFHIYVQGPGTKDAARVRKAIGWSVVLEKLVQPPGLFLFCRADSVGDALHARERVLKLQGIEHSELILEREGAMAVAQLEALCREAKKRAPASRPDRAS